MTKDRAGKGELAKAPSSLGDRSARYAERLAEMKVRAHAAQKRATLSVNHELLRLYWRRLGRDILERPAREGWGAGIVDQVSSDLRSAFPEMKGFSRANLIYMQAFAEAWPDPESVQQPVGQFPWGHNLFDFLGIGAKAGERQIEDALVIELRVTNFQT